MNTLWAYLQQEYSPKCIGRVFLQGDLRAGVNPVWLDLRGRQPTATGVASTETEHRALQSQRENLWVIRV
ncbi:hypothetical protein OUZ56_033203 [Daphnia magna]|uniref:Uncharacterized protein n=1 Tax=Daphnia magna TaxID=35525 RepID=A0ABQ9ZXQ1_9CRUS|nr:hypothetical protein OUZ56_033203 [Daphnia magna]